MISHLLAATASNYHVSAAKSHSDSPRLDHDSAYTYADMHGTERVQVLSSFIEKERDRIQDDVISPIGMLLVAQNL